MINLVREPPNALEDRFVLPEEVRLAAPKLHKLDRELFKVRLSLSGHVPVIGTTAKSMNPAGLLDHLEPSRLGARLSARADVQLAKHGAHVRVHSSLGEHEPLGDLRVPEAGSDER